MAFTKNEEAKLNIVEITNNIKRSVEQTYNGQRIIAIGEVVQYSLNNLSGHAYFNLKEGSAIIATTFFKGRRLNGLKIFDSNGRPRDPKDGDIVKVLGTVSIYAGSSKYQFNAERIELANNEMGVFAKMFEETMKKLISDGIINENFERINPPIRPIPQYAKKVAVLTAEGGAVIHDFRKTTIEQHGMYEIDLYSIHVQNVAFAPEIVETLKYVNSTGKYDVVVLMRGGGSKEELSLFNDYNIAKTIVTIDCPVIVSIGHEVDFTIAELVSDKRASTPTLAAAFLCEHYNKVDILINNLHKTLLNYMETYKRNLNMKLDYDFLRLEKYSPKNIVNNKLLEIGKYEHQMYGNITRRIGSLNNNVDKITYTLSKHNPNYLIENYRLGINNQRRNIEQSINQKVLELKRKISDYEKRIVISMKEKIDNINYERHSLTQRLNHKSPNTLIENYLLKIESLEKQLKPLMNSKQTEAIVAFDNNYRSFKGFVTEYNFNLAAKISTLSSKLQLLDPFNILDRGYAIVSQNGKVVSSVNNLNKDNVEIKFKDGIAIGNIESVNSNEILDSK